MRGKKIIGITLRDAGDGVGRFTCERAGQTV